MTRLPLRYFLFMAIALSVALPLAVLGGTLSSRWSDQVRAQLDRDASSRADALVREVGDGMSHRIGAVRLLARTIETQDDWRLAVLEQQVETFREESGLFDFMYVANASGVSLATSPAILDGEPTAGVDYSDRDYYRAMVASNDVAISRVQLGKRSGRPNIQIVAPIFRDGEMVGFAEGSVDLALLESRARTLAVDGEDLRVVILDHDKRVLADSAQLGDTLTSYAGESVFAKSGEASGPLEGKDNRGIEMRYSFTSLPLQSSEWSVFVGRPVATIDAAANAPRRTGLQIAFVSLSLGLVVSFAFSSWVSRPFRRLDGVIRDMGEGKYDTLLPDPGPVTPREVYALTEALRSSRKSQQQHEVERQAFLVKLQKANARLRPLAEVWEQISEAVEITTLDGHLLFVNPAFERLMGVDVESVVGLRASEVYSLPDISVEMASAVDRHVRGGNTWTGRQRCRHSSGKVHTHEVTISPILNRAGAVVEVATVRRDVTDRIENESRLRLSERMVSIGTMASGIAHEINNPLTYIQGNLSYLAEMLEAKGLTGRDQVSASEALREALDGVGKVSQVVRDLALASRSPDGVLKPVSVQEVVESSVRIVEPQVRPRGTISLQVDDERQVRGNAARLSQVLINLLMNASESLPTGNGAAGRITVRVHSIDEDWVGVEISDTGRGIAPENLGRVYDPFFTTKEVGQGSGLGLSISRQMIQGMGGKVRISSKEGVGTSVYLTLPVCPKSVLEEHQRPAKRPKPTTRKPSILVVDDIPAVAKVVRRALRGYDVTVSFSAQQAIELLRSRRFDVVLSDVMMPEMNGIDLHRYLLENQPDAFRNFLFMSGGVSAEDALNYLRERQIPLVHKPISFNDLRETLGAALGEVPEA